MCGNCVCPHTNCICLQLHQGGDASAPMAVQAVHTALVPALRRLDAWFASMEHGEPPGGFITVEKPGERGERGGGRVIPDMPGMPLTHPTHPTPRPQEAAAISGQEGGGGRSGWRHPTGTGRRVAAAGCGARCGSVKV